jgi:hypothetical protein
LHFPYLTDYTSLTSNTKKIAEVYLGSVDGDVRGLDGHDRGILHHQSVTYNNDH